MSEQARVVITGGTGHLGQAVAQELLARGCAVLVTSRVIANATFVKERLQNLYPNLRIEAAELALHDSKSIDRFVSMLVNEFRPDVLINNAASDDRTAISDLSAEHIAEYLNVNLVGSIYLSAKVASYWKSRQVKGRMITVSSLLAQYGAELSALYGVAKAGLESFTRHLTAEFSNCGISFNNLEIAGMGGELIPFGAESRVVNPEQVSPAQSNSLESIPLGRRAAPVEIASMIRFLAIDKIAFLNGQTIVLDGGIAARYPGYNSWK